MVMIGRRTPPVAEPDLACGSDKGSYGDGGGGKDHRGLVGEFEQGFESPGGIYPFLTLSTPFTR